ncbi:MAG TPA: hypothetical protein DCF68_10750 [Cyanothece sp. UBA12306]|nr:hypothetical protein [Cyanothece sp. UBA12306]
MKNFKLNSQIFLPVMMSYLIALPNIVLAQNSRTNLPEIENKPTDINELPNDSSQLTIWRCTQDKKMIVVEAKNVTIWQEMIEKGGWACIKALEPIPGGDRKFSCEPQEIIGIVTIFWLEGKGGKQQMTNWMNDLGNKNEMTCTKDETNVFWQ